MALSVEQDPRAQHLIDAVYASCHDGSP
jgi:hypothetical protein